jgi:hypothetical protein
MRPTWSGIAVFVAGSLACTASWAQGLADPTRPGGLAAPAESSEPAYSGPVLQSTMIAPGSKRAVISGRTYAVGDRFGAAEIVDIRSYEVVLNQGGRETRLRIVPPLRKDAAAGENHKKRNDQ